MALAVTAASNALTACLGFTDKLLGLGDKYYVQNKAWKRRKTRLENYKHDLTAWKDATTDRGLSSNPDLIRCLNEASARLKEAVEKVERKEGSRIAQVRRQMSRTVFFPSQVLISLQPVDDAFDNIRKTFEKEEEAGEVLDKEVSRSFYSDSLSPDGRYVHFNDTESKILEALNDDNGCPVVLLQGGAGRGKSTVAGNTAAQYDPERISTFACVVLHDCSSEGPIHFTELLHELIQRLGHKPGADAEGKETFRSIPLEKQFKSLLKERIQMLLILDDLRDEDFLLKMVAIGVRGLKILITAQDDTLCRNLDPNSQYVRINIQDIDTDTVRKILAAHAGFSSHEIPHNLQNYVDQLIATMDHQPLALAMLGVAVDESLRETEEEWVNLCRDLSNRLKSDKLSNGLFRRKYPRDLWSTLKLIIRTKLSKDTQNLLLLAHAFSDQVILEAAIWFLFNSVQQGTQTLS